MKKLIFSLCLLIALPLWAKEPVGQVADLVGNVWLTHQGAKPTQAIFRESIYLGDEIQTKAEGGIKILFIDDTLLTIKENSKVLITEFLFNPAEKTRKVSFDASFGRIRVIVGKFFGKAQPVEIKTPTAVAGIRGTDLGADVTNKTFYCFECEWAMVSIANNLFLTQRVSLKSGEAIEVLAGRAASPEHIFPIPEEILDQIDIQFDIPKGAATESTNKTTNETAKSVAAQTKPDEQAAPPKTEDGVMEKAATAKDTETTLNETTPTTADQQTEITPGAKEVKEGSTITITLP